ncbi:MAG: acyl-CoA dehydrogenase family protein [Chloroflexota bacterium]|jgi:alkylation response protein AidB-like acyl-CoA dehydrogenase|nr:acyl-CoA/acyl-ACP dehydrogenase [Dehalococcoidia bacterium]MEE3013859.1 acyl-CoA dehydrogenase family protein [Chloroflexota bacterium]GIS95231.1 MAG: acyl-CoA dehydrogenase [Dehalococcoidia bacterium]|tara:strand:- start:2625 stop:3863 length:1239 start_codon:yes stop_codon:yes gene_type:complete
MDFELKALTEPGKRMVDLAEEHSANFAATAAEHDREGTFPIENVTAMKKSGFSAAGVPVEFGGMGVTSVHDCIVALNRLGRGEASTPLAYTMHLSRTLSTARALRLAIASGNQARRRRSEEMLKKIGAGELFITVANSERGADVRTSKTLATKTDGGWLFNGTKTFATGSPAADVLAVRARYINESGEERMGATIAPIDRPGVKIMNNWDGLGMRASGSHDVVFTDYFVSDEEFDDTGKYGEFNAPFLALGTNSSMGLSSIFLGIAETAHELAISAINRRDGSLYPMNQTTIAENEIDLAAARGILSRGAQYYDEFYQTGVEFPVGEIDNSPETAFKMIKNGACTKKFVMETAATIVDRCVTLYGGGAYVSDNPMAKLYRDVRAGQFMQPWARNQAIEIIGKVALDLDPNNY